MKTIILNGSPKKNPKISNSRIFAEKFVSKMKTPCEIRSILKSDPKELSQYVRDFDSIIFVIPLYIHAMPGIVKKFIEELEPAQTAGKSMGFIVQAGFIETSQHDYLEPYFADLAKQLNYNYLGTVSKGQAAAVYMLPKMFGKILRLVADLGKEYEKNHSFDQKIVKKLGAPYTIPKNQLYILNALQIFRFDNFFWDRELKKNNALDKRLDKPFLCQENRPRDTFCL